MMNSRNKIIINLSSDTKGDKEYFTFIARINGSELKLYKDDNIEITKSTSYRKKLVNFFIEKRIILFIVENYILPNDKIEPPYNAYFIYTGARNAASNFYAMIKKVLNKLNFCSGVPVKDFDNLTLEMIYNNRDNPKFQELFDYTDFENKYPEYYISFLLFVNICILKAVVFSMSGTII